MEADLTCNFKKCRKRLLTEAWITSCSHVFCVEHGAIEFNKGYVCPACQNSLTAKYDLIRVDLQPSEQYKSMVLAGMKPETVMEICSRALSFWSYQSQQERTFHEYMANKSKEKASQLEKYYEDVIKNTQSELNYLKNQITIVRRELESTKQKFSEVSSKLVEKNRQYHKLQNMYDTLRRKCITPATFEPGNSGDIGIVPISARRHSLFPFTTSTNDLINAQCHHHGATVDGIRSSPPEREFVLRPNTTPILDCPVANVHTHLNNVRNGQFVIRK